MKVNTMFFSTRRSLSILSFSTALILAASAAGCTDDNSVKPDAEIVDRTTQALAIGDLKSINGEYGALCDERTGAWSVKIDALATLDNDPLSVLKNDTDCALKVTSIIAENAADQYDATPDLAIGSAYQGSASAFADGANPVAFYANAKMTPADFSDDFLVTILYSDDPNAASFDHEADFAQWLGSAEGDQVAAPNYTKTDSLVVGSDVNDEVTDASGSVDFTDGSVVAERYFVDLNTLSGSPTYLEIKGVFDAGSSTAISGADPSIAASELALIGEGLPAVRTVIFRHMEDGVASFQTFKITINPPSP